MNKLELANAILDYRIDKNLTQKQLADLIGISEPTFNAIEQQKRNYTPLTERKILKYIEENK